MSVASHDYFAKARAWAATALFVAGGLAVIGAFLDWVTITDLPPRLTGSDAAKAVPFSGMDLGQGWFRDGYMVIAGGVLLMIGAVMLILKSTSGPAWFCFFVSIFVGAIAIADYRGIDEIFFTEMDRVGKPIPGVGLTLVAISGLLGLVASAGGVAASPRKD